MTKETYEVIQRLGLLGIDYETAQKLRRISLCLRRWHELECGTENAAGSSVSVERDENGKPFERIQYWANNKWQDRKYPIPDRETGARKRLEKIMQNYPNLVPYIQGDPRGAALYLLRKGVDIKKGEQIDSIYTRGVCIY